TPISTASSLIFAQADYLRAHGYVLMSAAVARNLNAESASKEMDNSLKWLSTYFERRRLNREAREAENPGYLESLELRKKQYRRIIDNDLAAMEGDWSVKLNWMLRELLASTS